MRKRRVEIFFVLYLTALVGFVVVSKERDKHDVELERQKSGFLSSFLQPVTIEFASDTIYWYVSTEKGSNNIMPPVKPFSTTFTVFDIGASDSMNVDITSVTHNNLLVSPKLVKTQGRTVFGDLRERMVKYDLDCHFTSTGQYTVIITVNSKRIHKKDEKNYVYRDIVFPREFLSEEIRTKMERSREKFTVIVKDTSIAKPLDVPNITVQAEEAVVASALGFEETNTVSVNLGFYKPLLSIIEGYGKLERLASDNKAETYTWTGPVKPFPYHVTIEAKASRNAGGKDIARTSFEVHPILPYVIHKQPDFGYSGELFSTNIKVEGLDDDELYSWDLYERVGPGSLSLKFSGNGTKVQYRIPKGFSGKTLVVDGRYMGKKYQRIDKKTGIQSQSYYIFPVINPPVQIGFTPPSRMSTEEIYRFSAYRYSTEEYKYDQPITSLDDVKVMLKDQKNKPVQTNVRMISPGRFEFAIIQGDDTLKPGTPATLQIDVDKAKRTEKVILVK